MTKNKYRFDRRDLERVDKQLQLIKKACKELTVFSLEKGGIPVIDRNVERMTAPLKLLSGISEVLEIVREKQSTQTHPGVR
jgi:hypothetical protein